MIYFFFKLNFNKSLNLSGNLSGALIYLYTCTCIQIETTLKAITYMYSCFNIVRRSFMLMKNCPAQYPFQVLCKTLEFIICNYETICRPVVMLYQSLTMSENINGSLLTSPKNIFKNWTIIYA